MNEQMITSKSLVNVLFLGGLVMAAPSLQSCSQSLAPHEKSYVLSESEGVKQYRTDAKANKEFYDRARATLSRSEADVYQQGDVLIIRLKGLSFPTAESTLEDDDLTLLAKVQNVIEDSGQNHVLIEGHTDSRGRKADNLALSEKRAIAVKEYLQQHNGGMFLDIKTSGFESQRPLASNMTSRGRAMNRRVEIIILPEGREYKQEERQPFLGGWPLL